VNELTELSTIFGGFVFHVHSGGGLGLVEMMDRFLAAVSNIELSGLGRFLLPGVSEMANVHPLLVHFPIALLTAFLVVELLVVIFKREDLENVASWMLYLGTLGAMATVAAGWLAAQSIPHGSAVHDVMETHETLGFSVLALAVALSLWRLLAGSPVSVMGRALHLFLAFVMIGLLTAGADLGGLMVYKYGVAVKAVPQPENHDHAGMREHDQNAVDVVRSHSHGSAGAEPESQGHVDSQQENHDKAGAPTDDQDRAVRKPASHDHHTHTH
jgi:uncharacterized membrane protein